MMAARPPEKKVEAMTVPRPDYSDCLANFAVSILNAFGVRTEGRRGIPDCTAMMEKPCRNVVVLLLDGMGTAIVEQNLSPGGFFRSHYLRSYSSVFPPTTVAATTSILSGLEPVAHSWLGWDCYYPAIGENVTVFRNTLQGTTAPAAPYNVAQTFCGYTSILEQIRQHGGQAFEVSPFAVPNPRTADALFRRIREVCSLPGRKFVYAYWPEPDGTMHRTGVTSPETKAVLSELEEKTALLSASLEDTLLIVTADHGQRNARGAVLTDYPALAECLERMPSIEPRALNLYVKAGMAERFRTLFLREFGDSFWLLSRQQVQESGLFGRDTPHPEFAGMLGDFLAVATGDLAIYRSREEADAFIGVHAGLTRQELEIPLIVCTGG